MSYNDPSKYGAPPSYEEATSGIPPTTDPSGYPVAQSGLSATTTGTSDTQPHLLSSEGTQGLPYPQYSQYPSSYPSSPYPPQSGYPINTAAAYQGPTCGVGYGQYGQNQQIPSELDRRMRRRKIVFMSMFIFVVLLVIFALTRWFLT
ncbi:uncharacterized protein LOC128163929 [Crassostrea angulata]|uniref:uncharacterized protein LOC128163929 n=1 Tax=Magallana angulata TaxID=2784310 RepID=UPI0022B0B594|nr:uncharacterized protein LOC128163929 [Crassostrea angulata]